MSTTLTIIREFHTTRRRDGLQHLRPDPEPETQKGKIPRVSRLMALAIHLNPSVFNTPACSLEILNHGFEVIR